MIDFKPGTRIDNVKPHTWFWLGVVYSEWQHFFGQDIPFTVTSLYRPMGDSPSAHGRGEAFDLRRPVPTTAHPQELPFEDFCRLLQKRHGASIGVQLEPEWGRGVGYSAPHIHIQIKPYGLLP